MGFINIFIVYFDHMLSLFPLLMIFPLPLAVPALLPPSFFSYVKAWVKAGCNLFSLPLEVWWIPVSPQPHQPFIHFAYYNQYYNKLNSFTQ